jgi:hypothetical protein
MERAAPAIWQPLDLWAAAQAMGSNRGRAHTLAELLGPPERPGEASVGCRLCRWPLRARQQGGPQLGKTTRGKGTTWLVLVDGAGTSAGSSPWRRLPRQQSRSSSRPSTPWRCFELRAPSAGRWRLRGETGAGGSGKERRMGELDGRVALVTGPGGCTGSAARPRWHSLRWEPRWW